MLLSQVQALPRSSCRGGVALCRSNRAAIARYEHAAAFDGDNKARACCKCRSMFHVTDRDPAFSYAQAACLQRTMAHFVVQVYILGGRTAPTTAVSILSLELIDLEFSYSAEVALQDGTNGTIEAARYGSALIYHPQRKALLLFGGFSSSGSRTPTARNDLLILDLASSKWSVLSPHTDGSSIAPPPAKGSALALLNNQTLALFGGASVNASAPGGLKPHSQLWFFDLVNLTWTGPISVKSTDYDNDLNYDHAQLQGGVHKAAMLPVLDGKFLLLYGGRMLKTSDTDGTNRTVETLSKALFAIDVRPPTDLSRLPQAQIPPQSGELTGCPCQTRTMRTWLALMLRCMST